MASLTITVNSNSSTPPSLSARANDTVYFAAGTEPPAYVHFATTALFGSTAIAVGTTPTVQSGIADGEYPFFDEEQDVRDPVLVKGTQIGNIKVG